jgi:hypothetical protein
MVTAFYNMHTTVNNTNKCVHSGLMTRLSEKDLKC